ncbi:MAG: hypothetical protein Q9187_000528 [Circinaria calcarea]
MDGPQNQIPEQTLGSEVLSTLGISQSRGENSEVSEADAGKLPVIDLSQEPKIVSPALQSTDLKHPSVPPSSRTTSEPAKESEHVAAIYTQERTQSHGGASMLQALQPEREGTDDDVRTASGQEPTNATATSPTKMSLHEGCTSSPIAAHSNPSKQPVKRRRQNDSSRPEGGRRQSKRKRKRSEANEESPDLQLVRRLMKNDDHARAKKARELLTEVKDASNECQIIQQRVRRTGAIVRKQVKDLGVTLKKVVTAVKEVQDQNKELQEVMEGLDKAITDLIQQEREARVQTNAIKEF